LLHYRFEALILLETPRPQIVFLQTGEEEAVQVDGHPVLVEAHVAADQAGHRVEQPHGLTLILEPDLLADLSVGLGQVHLLRLEVSAYFTRLLPVGDLLVELQRREAVDHVSV